MRDIPVFVTENGVGSITLKEVPYKGVAYIKIQSTQQPICFLGECIDFCKMAGAEKVFASGHKILESYPLHNMIVRMSVLRENLPECNASLFPVTEKTAEQWRNIYNEKMRTIDNSSTMTRRDMEELVKQGGGYFVHCGEELLGIGIARGEMIESVIGLKQGVGKEVLLSLCSCLSSERIVLEVASTNFRAIKLYEKLGFIPISEVSSWYDVLTRKNT